MTPLSDIRFTMYILPVQALWLLIFLAQTFVLIYCFFQKRGTVYRVFNILNFTFGFFVLSALLDGTFMARYLYPAEEYGWYGRPFYPPFVDYIYSLPWIIAAIIAAAEIIVLVLCIVSGLKFSRGHISDGAVKETVDMLPMGIGFSNPGGIVMLSNIKMNDWCYEISEDNLINLNEFIKIIHEKGEDLNGQTLVVTENNHAYLFFEKQIKLEGNSYTQLTGTDISEQYRITENLKDNNEHLKEIHNRFKEYSENLTELVLNKELLSARGIIHSEIGHTLLVSKAYIENPESVDEEELLKLLKESNTIISNAGKKADKNDCYFTAVRRAAKIGVTVQLTGVLPEEDNKREIIAKALDECAANTKKHACGNNLYLRIIPEDRGIIVEIKNDGEVPKSSVVETGGLLYLRKKVESAGGKMTVLFKPRFVLRIELE